MANGNGNGNGNAWFRWIVTGILGVTAGFASVIWWQIRGDISDIRADTKALALLISAIQLNDQARSDQIKELSNRLDEHLKEPRSRSLRQ